MWENRASRFFQAQRHFHSATRPERSCYPIPRNQYGCWYASPGATHKANAPTAITRECRSFAWRHSHPNPRSNYCPPSNYLPNRIPPDPRDFVRMPAPVRAFAGCDNYPANNANARAMSTRSAPRTQRNRSPHAGEAHERARMIRSNRLRDQPNNMQPRTIGQPRKDNVSQILQN